jgi:hypothetical protein
LLSSQTAAAASKFPGWSVATVLIEDGVPVNFVSDTAVYLSNQDMVGGRAIKSVVHALGKVSVGRATASGCLVDAPAETTPTMMPLH